MHAFVTPHTDHLENIGTVSYTNLPNVETFRPTISKKIILISPPICHKSLSMKKLQGLLAVTDTSFPNSVFH